VARIKITPIVTKNIPGIIEIGDPSLGSEMAARPFIKLAAANKVSNENVTILTIFMIYFYLDWTFFNNIDSIIKVD
jgi:hypothetical protein